MRSKGYMIDASKFRHRGTFKVYSVSTNRMIPSKNLDSQLSVWFSFIASTGLRDMGEESQIEVEQSEQWQALISQDKIVTRFVRSLHDSFDLKKEILLSWNSRDFRVIKAVDLNGESIYSIWIVEDVK